MKTIARLTLAGALLAVLAVSSTARTPRGDRSVVRGSLGKRLDAAVRAAGGAGFWGSVLVAREGEILLASGYGSADCGNTPNTPRTLHELASASKQVTAAAILHLEQRGKLSVTDSLDRFFPDVPADKKEAQLHHLLTHTSGIPDTALVPYASTIPRKPFVRRVLGTPLVSRPGETYRYCNVDYALLAAVVESVSKGSFEDYVERNLFRKARCADTGFVNDRDLRRSGRCSKRRTNEPGDWTAADWHWGWGYKGMGGVVTTVLDVHRWDRALRGCDLLGEKAKRKLYAPDKASYAYGWKVEVTGTGTRKAHHSGSVAGYGTNIIRHLEDDILIVVLTNHGQPAYEVSVALERIVFEPPRLRLQIDRKGYRSDVRGAPQLPAKLDWEVRRSGRALVIRLRDRRKTPLEIVAPRSYDERLRSALEQAIAARESDDPGGPAAVEARLDLRTYPTTKRLLLDEGIEMTIEPEDRTRDATGKWVLDRRVVLTVRDGKHGLVPFKARLNVAAARALLEALERR